MAKVLESEERVAADEKAVANADVAVRVEDLSVRLSLQKEAVLSLREAVIRFLQRRPVEIEEFWPLRNVSFTARRGEAFGILGRNGAGKSTLLKTVAGVLSPTLGRVEARGRIAPLLELGAGFDTDLTGRENVYLYGSLLGFPRKAINERFDRIIEFAELERFVDVPLKNYSSGMSTRLAFAVATDVDADILIVDEALTVGDSRFQLKCMERIESFQRRGVTILFVSHSSSQIRELCTNAIWLDNGEVQMLGPAREVVDAYAAFQHEPDTRAVSWPRPELPAAVREDAGRAREVSIAYRAPGAVRHTPPIKGEYDFLDISLATDTATSYCSEVFGGRGLCVSNDQGVVERVRERGHDAIFTDLFEIDFPDGSFGYVSMMDCLNLLPGLGEVKTLLSNAARWGRDFVFVRMPSYEDEAYLRALGLKHFWYEWTRYPMHPRLDQLTAILQSLSLEQFHISMRQPAISSEASSLLPIDAPPDQGDFDPALHGTKSSIVFERPVYAQIDIFIALRPYDTGEWHEIIRRGTWS